MVKGGARGIATLVHDIVEAGAVRQEASLDQRIPRLLLSFRDARLAEVPVEACHNREAFAGGSDR